MIKSNVRTPHTIITYSSDAHRDCVLGSAMLLQRYPSIDRILRRKPEEHELESPDVLTLAIGGRDEPARGNFDAGRRMPGGWKKCVSSLTLVMRHLGLPDKLHCHLPWAEFTNIIDACGPQAAAEYIGTTRRLLIQTTSPIETAICRMFQSREQLTPGTIIWGALKEMGQIYADHVSGLVIRLNKLPNILTVHTVGHRQIVDASAIQAKHNPLMGLNGYIEAEHPNAVAVIHRTSHHNGLCVFVREGFDLSFDGVKDYEEVRYVHKTGRVMAVKKDANIWAVIEAAALMEGQHVGTISAVHEGQPVTTD